MAGRIEDAVDAYLGAWNERDASRRARLLDTALADDAEMAGPTGSFRGREALDRLITALQERMADATIVRVGEVDDDGRFAWHVVSPAGEVVLAGTDEVRAAPDGRLSLIRVHL